MVRDINPSVDTITQVNLSGVKSVILTGIVFTPPVNITTWALLRSPNSSLILFNSEATSSLIFFGDLSRDSKERIAAFTDLNSSSIFFRSREAKRRNGISRIAWACSTDNLNCFRRLSRAVSTVRDLRITSMTASRFVNAVLNPSRICARCFARFNSNWLRSLIISNRWSRKTRSDCLRLSMRGSPSTRANMIILKVFCIGVRLYNSPRTISGSAVLINSITIRIPWRSDSSLKSANPSIFPSLAKSAIRPMSEDLFVRKGSSVTTIRCLPLLISSICARARIWIRPRPRPYADFREYSSPASRINPPVGKSGPWIYFIRSSTLTSSIFFQFSSM